MNIKLSSSIFYRRKCRQQKYYFVWSRDKRYFNAHWPYLSNPLQNFKLENILFCIINSLNICLDPFENVDFLFPLFQSASDTHLFCLTHRATSALIVPSSIIWHIFWLNKNICILVKCKRTVPKCPSLQMFHLQPQMEQYNYKPLFNPKKCIISSSLKSAKMPFIFTIWGGRFS